MSLPEPVTPPTRDAGMRFQTASGLEKALVGFLQNLFDSARLDNPTLNLAQVGTSETFLPLYVGRAARFVPFDNGVTLEVVDPNDPTNWIPQAQWTEGDFTGQSPVPPADPDQPPVSYDYTQRAQTLALKVAPQVVRGRVPRTVTGEVATDKLPDVPHIIVQCMSAKVETDCTHATVRMLFSTYDENPDCQGYLDGLNMVERAVFALTQYGQQGIDKAYPIVLPLEWKMVEGDTLSHFIAEVTSMWELASARPLPDADVFGLVPAENLDFHLETLPRTREMILSR